MGAIMRRIVLVFGLGLAGCAGPAPFDASAVPNAQATMQAANEQCVSRLRSGQFKNAGEFAECAVRAKVQFTMAINLRDGTILNAYIARMGTAAGDLDAGTIKFPDYAARVGQIYADFDNGLAQAYSIDAQEKSMAAARAVAFGQALSNAGASISAATPAFSPSPMSCQSYQVGYVRQTNCQ